MRKLEYVRIKRGLWPISKNVLMPDKNHLENATLLQYVSGFFGKGGLLRLIDYFRNGAGLSKASLFLHMSSNLMASKTPWEYLAMVEN